MDEARNGRNLDDVELTAVGRALETALAEFDALVRPATHQELGVVLLAWAELFDAPEPGEHGLHLWMEAVSPIPLVVLERVKVEIAANHKYRRLPNPVEVRAAAAQWVETINTGRRWLTRNIEINTQRLARLNAAHHQERIAP